MNFIKAYWDRLLVIIAAIAALGVAVSGNETAKTACFATSKCKAAYELGLSAEEVSATTTTQAIIVPVSPTDAQ